MFGRCGWGDSFDLTDVGSSAGEDTAERMAATPMFRDPREPWRYETDSDEEVSDDGLDAHGLALPPGWLTLLTPNGRTFKWTDGVRTLGTLTEVWASVGVSGGGSGMLSPSEVSAGSTEEDGACAPSAAEGEEEEDDGFLSVAALLGSLQLTGHEQVQLLAGSSCGERAAAEAPLLEAQEQEHLLGDSLQILQIAYLFVASQDEASSSCAPTAAEKARPRQGGSGALHAAVSGAASAGASTAFGGPQAAPADGSRNRLATPFVFTGRPQVDSEDGGGGGELEALFSTAPDRVDRAWETLNAAEVYALLAMLGPDEGELAVPVAKDEDEDLDALDDS